MLRAITLMALASVARCDIEVLVHASVTTTSSMFDKYDEAITVTSWNNYDWETAAVADFEAFDIIYVGDTFSGRPTSVHDNKGNMALAALGRIVVTNQAYELCQTSNGTWCDQLHAAIDWVLGNPATGLIASGQTRSDGPDWLPSDGPWNGVSYDDNAINVNIVEITDTAHPIASGESNDDLSNWIHSMHATFSGTGSFTSIADVCDASGTLPTGGDPTTECSGNMENAVLTYDPPQWYCRSPGATSGSYQISKCSEACGGATFISVRCCEGDAFEDDGKCKNSEKVSQSLCLTPKPVCP